MSCDERHWTQDDWHVASETSIHNRPKIQESCFVGCYYCRNQYHASLIKEYIDEAEDTAICPMCGIDAVLPDASGLPVTEIRYLEHMHWYGFGHCKTCDETDVRIDRPSYHCAACMNLIDFIT